MKTVATSHLGYPETRNIQCLPFDRYQVVKKFNVFKIPDHLFFKINGRTSNFYHNFHYSLKPSECDLYHLFNGVSWNKKPWVSTFETFIPRLWSGEKYWNKHPEFWNKKAVKLMASEWCKKLIALSENSADIQKIILEKYYPEFAENITQKIEIIHPQQNLFINSYSEKKFDDDRISFTIASPDFFNKGGKEILQVFDRIMASNKNVVLHIVSSIQYGDKHTKSTKSDWNEAWRIINKHKDQIYQYDYLPNEELMALFKKTHVHIRTSYVDTYGFSVLEAQANGCAIISTNIRALGIINNSDTGYVIDVPKDEYGNAIIEGKGDRKAFSLKLSNSLEEIIAQILNHPNELQIKGENAIARIAEIHNPITKAQKLESIYDQAIG